MLVTSVLMLSLVAVLQVTASQGHGSVGKEVREVFPGVGEYYFSGVPSNWTEAYKTCKLSGGHLAYINNDAEADAIKQMMSKFSTLMIHMGFHDQFTEGDYDSVLGEPVDSECGNRFWATDSPKGNTTFNCGGYSELGFTDTECATKRVFICELTGDQTGETPLDGFEVIEGHGSYKYYEETTSWPAAWSICRSQNAHLLVINSEVELAELYNKYNYHVAWVGVHRLYGDNADFITVFDEPLRDTGYSQWSGRNPFGSFISEPYVAVNDNQGLVVTSRNYHATFICERDE